MEEFRDATAEAIDSLGYDVVRAEDFYASPDSPRLACLQGVQKSDVVILLIGERYGDPQISGLSPTHEEYEEARKNNVPVIIMVQKNVSRETKQNEFLRIVREWDDGHYTGSFGCSVDLRKNATRALHALTHQLAHTPHEASDISNNAIHELSQDHNLQMYHITQPAPWHPEQSHYVNRVPTQSPTLALCLSCGHSISILRPSQIEEENLIDALRGLVFHEHNSLFSAEVGTQAIVDKGNLVVVQEDRFVRLDEFGTLTYVTVIPRRFPLLNIVEEDVEKEIVNFIEFSKKVLDHIDDSFRLSFCAVAANLLNVNFMGWITQQQQQRNFISGTSTSLRYGQTQFAIQSLPVFRRNDLSSRKTTLARDLTILLRRLFHN